MSNLAQIDRGALRAILDEEKRINGRTLKDLTVLAACNDPYRQDTPANHRVAEWLATHVERLIPLNRRIHLRGLHYALVAAGDVARPDGRTYINDDETWAWLVSHAAKAARWLGYVPFDRIVDARNSEPAIHRAAPVSVPKPWYSVEIAVDIPTIDDIEPQIFVEQFQPQQPYALAIFGEKTSLEDVLLPIARHYGADLYLPSGEISDTLLHHMARDAAADGRPFVVFTLADCDPAGHQMPVSIGRKLQALRDLLFPELRFSVVPVGLTVDQVRAHGLPSTPLKTTERRADRWRAEFGVEQTEIDALATLKPALLSQIVQDAITPYFDDTLERRAWRAREEWLEAAQEHLSANTDAELIQQLHDEAAYRFSELQNFVAEINLRLRSTVTEEFRLPPVKIPEAEASGAIGAPALVDFGMGWLAITAALRARKAYGDAGDAA